MIIGFVVLVIDRAGRQRPPKSGRQAIRETERALPKAERRAARAARHAPVRRISRAIARRIIARQDRKARAGGIYLPPDPEEQHNA